MFVDFLIAVFIMNFVELRADGLTLFESDSDQVLRPTIQTTLDSHRLSMLAEGSRRILWTEHFIVVTSSSSVVLTSASSISTHDKIIENYVFAVEFFIDMIEVGIH